MVDDTAEQSDDEIVISEKERIQGGVKFLDMLEHAIVINPSGFQKYFWKKPESTVLTQRILWHAVRVGDMDLIRKSSLVEVHVSDMPMVPRWRGLDIRHINNPWVMATLGMVGTHLNQEMVNFVTCADLGKYTEDILIQIDDYAMMRYRIDEAPETINKETLIAFGQRHFLAQNGMDELAIAFGDKMIDEAKPYHASVYTGFFTMKHIQLPELDKLVLYDEIRLVITPSGILASFVYHSEKFYTLAWWGNNGIQSGWIHSERFGWAFHVFASCLWRDACVVAKKALATKRTIVASKKDRKRSRNKGNGKVVLPRTIYEVQWADDSDREHIVHRAHQVRGHYRMLREGWSRSEMAVEKAQEWGYPEPPDGFTFAEPHQRGSGEPLPKIRPVVCKGFQVANIVMQELEKRG